MSKCSQKNNNYLTNINSYYRDYNDYLYNKRCCNKLCSSVNNNNVFNLGNRRCCSNNVSNYYNSYSYFLNL